MTPLVVILARLRRWQNTRLIVLCCARARVGLPHFLLVPRWNEYPRPRARGAAEKVSLFSTLKFPIPLARVRVEPLPNFFQIWKKLGFLANRSLARVRVEPLRG